MDKIFICIPAFESGRNKMAGVLFALAEGPPHKILFLIKFETTSGIIKILKHLLPSFHEISRNDYSCHDI